METYTGKIYYYYIYSRERVFMIISPREFNSKFQANTKKFAIVTSDKFQTSYVK